MVENPTPERIKIGIADVTDIAQSQGRQKGYEATRQVRHEAKNPQSRLSRFGAVMKNLGSAIANNYLGEFRRERAKHTAVGEMKRSQQLVHDHEGVVRRSIERAVSDLPDEDVLFSEKGEKRYSSDENVAASQIKQKLKDFIHFQVMLRDLDRGRFESGKRALIAEIRQIAERSRDPSMRGLLSKDGVFADNLWDVVTELRQAYDDNAYHQDRLDDIDFTLAKMGDVVESRKGITDKILSKISGNRLGALVANSGVLSALTALGVSVGVSAGKIGASMGANTVLPVVGGAVAGGAVAAVGEARRVEGEAQYLQRERVLNGDDSADLGRNTRVGEIQAGLLEVVDGDIFAGALDLARGSGNPDYLFDLLVELKARDDLALKGRPTIKNRDSLDLLRARSEALIAMRREGRTDAQIANEAKKIVEARSNSADLGELAREVATKADIMRKLKRKRAAKMGLVTGGSALVVGSLVRHFAGDQLVDHSSTDDYGIQHPDIIPYRGGSVHTETGYWGDTVWNLKSSGDVKVVFDQAHHTLDIFDGNGHPIADLQDLRLNADGTMPADTLAQIKASGIEVAAPNITHETMGGHYVGVPVEHTVTREIPISEWLKGQNPTHADGYYFWHNNSAGGTLNELVPQARISGEGVDFDISHMTSAGSFTGDRHLDVTQLMREGKMYLLVAPDPAHPADLVKIPFDRAGHLHLDEDNPLYQVFSKRGEGVGFAGRWWGVGYVENSGGRNIVNTVAALQGSHTFKDITASVVEKTVEERWVAESITRAGYEFAKGNPLPEAIGEGAREVGRRMGEALGGSGTIAVGARSPLEKNRTPDHVDEGFENFPPPAPPPPPEIENPILDDQTTDEALKRAYDALDFSEIDTHGREISEADRVIYIIPPRASRFFDFYLSQVLPQTIRFNYLVPNRDRKVTILIESDSSGGEISKADLGLDDDRIVLKHYQRGNLDQEMRNLRVSPDVQRLAYVDFSNVDGGVVRGGNIARYFGEEPMVDEGVDRTSYPDPEHTNNSIRTPVVTTQKKTPDGRQVRVLAANQSGSSAVEALRQKLNRIKVGAVGDDLDTKILTRKLLEAPTTDVNGVYFVQVDREIAFARFGDRPQSVVSGKMGNEGRPTATVYDLTAGDTLIHLSAAEVAGLDFLLSASPETFAGIDPRSAVGYVYGLNTNDPNRIAVSLNDIARSKGVTNPDFAIVKLREKFARPKPLATPERGRKTGDERFGVHSLRGKRSYQEDAYVTGRLGDIVVAGVFDGHGGNSVSHYLANSWGELFSQNMTSHGGDVQAAIRGAYGQAFENIRMFTDGSTSTTVYVDKTHIYAACLGDSRAVISKGGVATALTTDHRPDDREGLLQRQNEGRIGAVRPQQDEYGTWRVNGLMLYGSMEGNNNYRNIVMNVPDVTVSTRHDAQEFIIVASDGIWDVFNDQGAVDFVKSLGNVDPKVAGQRLCESAIAKGSQDNVTAVVVYLK